MCKMEKMAIPRPPALPSGPLGHSLGSFPPTPPPADKKESDHISRSGSIKSKISGVSHGKMHILSKIIILHNFWCEEYTK